MTGVRTSAPPRTDLLVDGDLAHVAGPLVGERVALSDGAWTDVHVSGPEDGEVVLLIPGLAREANGGAV